MMRTDKKTILITGASSGLGHALAIEYAGSYSDVTLLLMGRDLDRLQSVQALCADLGTTVKIAVIDVTNTQQMSDQILKWEDNNHTVDVVIANAGISGGMIDGAESALQTRQIFETNVGGVLNTVLPLVDNMTARRSGQIVIISSLAGYRGMPSAPAYSASKNAVRAWGQALRGDLKPKGVQVNVVCPGFIKTPLTDKNPFEMPFLMDAEKAAKIIIRGLEKNKSEIAFPWQLSIVTRLISILPKSASNWIVDRLPKK